MIEPAGRSDTERSPAPRKLTAGGAAGPAWSVTPDSNPAVSGGRSPGQKGGEKPGKRASGGSSAVYLLAAIRLDVMSES